MQSEPKLAPPGAGLPFTEWAITKFILLPHWFMTRNNEQALEIFARETETILRFVKPLSAEKLEHKYLVPKLKGIEDSSRYWSVAMALEHLVTVGELMRATILSLVKNQSIERKASTAAVKPTGRIASDSVIRSFEVMSKRFLKDVQAAELSKNHSATYQHPWFGELNAHQWLVVAGLHQAVHRNQIKHIIRGIKQ